MQFYHGTVSKSLQMEYNKIALDTPDLLAVLKQRGLKVSNDKEACEILSTISYFRLACYFICAHHARIWNRRYALKPQMPKTLSGHKWLTVFSFPPDKIYPQLCCIAYLLNAIDPHNAFANNIQKLIKSHLSINPAAMGFPNGWEQEPLWK